MRLPRSVRLALSVGLPSLALAASARADEQPSADLRGTFAPMHHDAGLSFEPADSPETGDITGVARLSYGFRPVVLREASGAIAYRVVEHQFTGDVAVGVGIAGRLTLGLDLPLLLGQTGDDLTAAPEAQALVGEQPVPVTSLGDPGLRAKVTLLKPERAAGKVRGVALAVDERFTLPLGDERSFLAEGGVASLTRVLFDAYPGVVSVHAHAGVKLRSDTGSYACPLATPEDECLSRFGHELPLGVGLALHTHELGIDPHDLGTILLEGRGHLPLSPVTPDQSTLPAGYFASIGGRLRAGDVAFLAAVELALSDGVGSAPFRATLGLSFAPRERDSDGDGAPDSSDKCPTWAEDQDGFEDSDGCPEMDNDADGVPDGLDACRDVPGPAGENESGCPK